MKKDLQRWNRLQEWGLYLCSFFVY
jgi:hypothetical protein